MSFKDSIAKKGFLEVDGLSLVEEVLVLIQRDFPDLKFLVTSGMDDAFLIYTQEARPVAKTWLQDKISATKAKIRQQQFTLQQLRERLRNLPV